MKTLPVDMNELAAALEDHSRELAPADSNHIVDLLRRFYESIVEAFEFDSFRPRLQQKGVMVTDPDAVIISWCHGFKLGVEHHQLAWKRWFEDTLNCKSHSSLCVFEIDIKPKGR